MRNYISSNEYFDNIQKFLLPNEKRNSGNKNILLQYGNIQLDYFNTGTGINYSSFAADFHEDTIMEGICSDDSCFFSFNTGSCICFKDIKTGQETTINKNICYNGKEYAAHKAECSCSKNRQFTWSCIRVETELFNNLMTNNECLHSNKQSILENDGISLNLNNYISIEQNTLLKEIENAKVLTGALKDIYLESKILSLLHSAAHESHRECITKTEIHLSSQDIIALQQAHNILLNNITTPPSLKDLAHKVAINEFKLKKGFKQLFGNTVYGLLQKQRLKQAKILLERDEVSVSEAAYLVGYKSLGHFSEIFKKHFGILPIQIKQSSKKVRVYSLDY